eukprot:4434653-Amphidinium_carterae.1
MLQTCMGVHAMSVNVDTNGQKTRQMRRARAEADSKRGFPVKYFAIARSYRQRGVLTNLTNDKHKGKGMSAHVVSGYLSHACHSPPTKV